MYFRNLLLDSLNVCYRKYTSCTLYDISICIAWKPTWRLADQTPLSRFFPSNESRISKDLPYIGFPFGVITHAEHFKASSFHWR